MTIQGIFKDRNDEDIEVIIYTDVFEPDRTIGDSWDDDIQFDKDPVTISEESVDITDVIRPTSCSIRLLTRHSLADKLFTANDRNYKVNVWKGSECLFAGYVEPNVYNQPYNHSWDLLEISCTGALSSLQYHNWRNCKNLATYVTRRANASSITFEEIIRIIFDNLGNLNLKNMAQSNFWYDGSVLTEHGADSLSVFKIGIFEHLLFGETFDDILTEEDVIKMIFTYLNLHVIQKGLDFYVYNWDSIKNEGDITWYPLFENANNVYAVVNDKYVLVDQNAYEVLQKLDSSGVAMRGNMLTKRLAGNRERLGNKLVQYYYWVLPGPNQMLVKSVYYEQVLPGNTPVIKKPDEDKYKILKTSQYGDYYFNGLEDPFDTYDSETDGYYLRDPNSFYIAQR